MTDGATIQAIGRDFGRYLPGLFWLNFFGRPHREMLGEARLLSVPGGDAWKVDDGVMVQLWDDPFAWNTPEYGLLEQRTRDHLGEELFFSHGAPDREGRVPDWGPS